MNALFALVLAAGLTLAAGDAAAQTGKYPTKPIRMIVPFAPGGGTDIVARVIAQKMSDILGQSVVVDNRPGGGGLVGTETAVRAQPDGYTLINVSGSYATNAAVYKLNYDPVRDVQPISHFGESAFVVVLHPSVAANNVAELVALAKSKPGVLNFASVGQGTSPHLGGEMLQSLAGIKLVHVPYKGTAPAMTDLIAGQVQLMFTSMPTVLAHVKTGRLKLLGTGGSKRSAVIPDTPPIAETVPGFELVTWYSVFAPARTPNAIVTRLNTEIAKVLADPESRDRLASQGLEPTTMTPEELGRYSRAELARWAKVIKAAGIKPQ